MSERTRNIATTCLFVAFSAATQAFTSNTGSCPAIVLDHPFARRQPTTLQHLPITVRLFLAKSTRASGGKELNTTKKQKKTKRSQKQGNKSLHEKELSRATQRADVVLPSSKTKAPPWQVLSAKDAKKNIEVEKKRRERARQGLPEKEEEQQQETLKEGTLVSRALMSDAHVQILKWKRFNPSTVPCGMSFIGSYLEKRLPPQLGVPEVAFLGRSNVGKSSLLNRLSAAALTTGGGNQQHHAADQARVGKTPGATASVNLYAMLGKAKRRRGDMAKPILGFADLPGFGYARLSKEVKDAVQLAAERYLEKREELALGILLVDARREPTDDDRAVLAALYDLGVPLVVVATKVDKLATSQVDANMERVRQGLGLPDGQPLCISSVTGEGTKQLWRIILEACESLVEELRHKLERADRPAIDKENIETIQLDDKGNHLAYNDDEDIAYDQGYDWVHDSAVLYEGDSDDYNDSDDEFDDYYDDYNVGSVEDMMESDKEKLKNLKKQARGMERRGEV